MSQHYRVIYTSSHQDHAIIHTTEWICPAGFDEWKARRSFRERYPSAAIIQLREWQLS